LLSEFDADHAAGNNVSMAESATGGGGALINLGDLSRPATVLIEKISDAVGGIAKPWQIVRVARAEVTAETIRAQGRMQISEIEERALRRMVREEGKSRRTLRILQLKRYLNFHQTPSPKASKMIGFLISLIDVALYRMRRCSLFGLTSWQGKQTNRVPFLREPSIL
jgi:hypothetical protein